MRHHRRDTSHTWIAPTIIRCHHRRPAWKARPSVRSKLLSSACQHRRRATVSVPSVIAKFRQPSLFVTTAEHRYRKVNHNIYQPCAAAPLSKCLLITRQPRLSLLVPPVLPMAIKTRREKPVRPPLTWKVTRKRCVLMRLCRYHHRRPTILLRQQNKIKGYNSASTYYYGTVLSVAPAFRAH